MGTRKIHENGTNFFVNNHNFFKPESLYDMKIFCSYPKSSLPETVFVFLFMNIVKFFLSLFTSKVSVELIASKIEILLKLICFSCVCLLFDYFFKTLQTFH